MTASEPTSRIPAPTPTPAPAPALALLVGALCFATGDLLRRTVDGSAATPVELMRAVDAHEGFWLVAGGLSVLAPVLMLPGLAWLVATTRGRGERATRLGAALLALGQLAAVGHAAAFYGLPTIGTHAGLSASSYDALDRASEHSPLLIGLIVLFILGNVVGTLVLFAGLRRARRVPVWSLVACVVLLATANAGGVAAGVLGLLVTVAMYAPLCWSVRPAYSPVERQGLRRNAAT
ncbi:hypothetical protein [Nocardioides panaciterrulae]|uniref:DUF4386 family protein n=1 Tax=Nocardioides panaciterrulae TaxID=661492 RepID=A0A7Y9E4L9_9ACTN|nr:hypothetical protein [Nocardioides panaciterrulae]NYD40877.1 hypothetical protein [Nocardioides panaciterrulae]